MPGDLTTEGLVEMVARAIAWRRVPSEQRATITEERCWRGLDDWSTAHDRECAKAALSAVAEAATETGCAASAMVLEQRAHSLSEHDAGSAFFYRRAATLLRALAGATSDGGR